MSEKSETKMKYCRQGWKDKTLLLAEYDEQTATCSLKDEAGTVVVTGLPVVLNPAAATPENLPGGLPKSYATPLEPQGSGSERAQSTVDDAKVAEILGKAKEPAAKVDLEDLNRVNLPTLHAILAGMERPAPEDAKSKDLKQAIIDAANAATPAS